MVTNICLFTCVLALGQVSDRQGWNLTPQLNVGQELVYLGFFKEQSLVPGVGFQREYRLNARLLVLEANKDGWDVAFLTALELLPNGPGNPLAAGTKLQKASLRLELAHVDLKGNVRSLENVDLSLPLDGPPTLEHGFVVPVVGKHLTKLDQWMIAEPGRPGQVWGIVGTDAIGVAKCVKLAGEQESPNWGQPQAAGDAWRRVDKVWINPQLGVAVRVERELKRRAAARLTPTHGCTLRYELDRQWTYPAGPMLETRKQDVMNAVKFGRDAEQLLPDHMKNAAALNVLIKHIKVYLEQNQPVQPYRQVMEGVLHRIDAVRKGQIKILPPAPEKAFVPAAEPGNHAPDFIVTDLTCKKALRLYELFDQPILIIFYNPQTATGTTTLQFGKKIHEKYQGKIHILGLAVTNKLAAAAAQHKELELPFPVADGTALRNTFAVTDTPRLILIDRDGVVRAAHTGWSFDTAEQIQADLHKYCPVKKTPSP